MMVSRHSLGSRFILVVILGVVLPIAGVGAWIARSATSSGEALLRGRLDESLGRAIEGLGFRWVDRRSALLGLAEHQAVIAALRSDRDVTTAMKDAAPALRALWDSLFSIADAVTFRNATGAERGSLERDEAAATHGEALTRPTVGVRFPVYDLHSTTRVGWVDIRVRLSELLPPGALAGSIGGSALALFDVNTGAALLPSSIAPEWFARDRFAWGGEEWIVVRRDVDDPPLRLALAAPTAPFTQPLSQAARRGSITLVLVLIGASLLALVLTRRITKPLERLVDASGAIARGELGRQVVEEGPDEIQRLGRTFNTMAASLRQTLRRLSQREAVAAVGEFAASLAHEVRNPLTSIRLDVERARERLNDPDRAEELLARAVHQLDRLDATVAGSLRIARSGSLEMSTVHLHEPIEAAVRAAAPAFAARGARLASAPTPDEALVVRGNAGALEQLVLNLLLNAAEALDKGGSAQLGLEASGGDVYLSVRDTGRGIEPAALARVWEPFYSTKDEGTGLGLPIARRIAHAHGGDLTIDSTPGVGTTVRVHLPAVSSEAQPAVR